MRRKEARKGGKGLPRQLGTLRGPPASALLSEKLLSDMEIERRNRANEKDSMHVYSTVTGTGTMPKKLRYYAILVAKNSIFPKASHPCVQKVHILNLF